MRVQEHVAGAEGTQFAVTDTAHHAARALADDNGIDLLDVDAQIAGLRDPVHPERAGVEPVVAETVSAAADAHALRAVRLGEVMVNEVRQPAAEVVADDGVRPHLALLPHSPGNGSRRNERENILASSNAIA